ncbi:hypothetical protein ID866_8525 [Astraeus odoratus]|nr:hypothetical protein ID866_8525 [Astraeus odoratus]
MPRAQQKAFRKTNNAQITLHDWLTVFAYIDAHPDQSHDSIVKHFKTQHEGRLIFNQSTVTRKLQDRKSLEACVDEFPNVLSSK